MKKILALLLVLVMMIGMVACGAKEEVAAPAATEAAPAPAATEAAPAETEPAGPKWEGETLVVNFSISSTEEEMLKWFEDNKASFEEATGATVEFRCLAADVVNTKQKTDLIGGTSADIIAVAGGSVYDYVDSGFLMELDAYLTEEDTKDWLFYDKQTVGGSHYVVPINGGRAYRCVALNADLCRELGLEVPAYDALTWDVLVEYSQKAIEAGYHGYVAPFSGNGDALIHNFYSYVHQAGGTFVTEDSKFDFSDPACLEAFQFVDRIFNEDKIIDTVSYDSSSNLQVFNEGTAMFATMSVGQYNYSLGVPDRWNFDTEVYNLRNERCGSFNGVDNIAVATTCKNPELAVEFIKWVMTPEIWETYRAGCSPSSAVLMSDAVLNALLPKTQHILTDTDFVFFPPMMDPNSAEITEQLQIQQQLVALGDVTPEEAVKTMQDLVESLK